MGSLVDQGTGDEEETEERAADELNPEAMRLTQDERDFMLEG